MSQQVKMNASAIGGQIQTLNSGTLAVPTDGIITVDSRDVPSLLALGATYINAVTKWQTLAAAPIAATNGRIVASTSFANGTLSIANQPDIARQCAVQVFPGTSAITGGNVALTYTANDGTTQVDNISAITALSTTVSTNTSKGVLRLTSAIITGVAGGTSPGIRVNDTNSLSVIVDPGFVDFVAVAEYADGVYETVGTVASTAASIVPSTAPNATHTYAFAFTCNAPNS